MLGGGVGWLLGIRYLRIFTYVSRCIRGLYNTEMSNDDKMG